MSAHSPSPAAASRAKPRPLPLNERQILDAARACVLAVGVHDTTLGDVARRAGVSRMTLYRRYSDISSLISEVLGHEFARILHEHAPSGPDERADARSARRRLVETVLAVVRAFHADPLLRQVLDAEPEILMPYLINRFGSTQQIAITLLANRLDAGHRDGSIRSGSVAVQAHAIVLAAQAFIVSVAATGPVPVARLVEELGVMLDTYLAPVPMPAASGSGPSPAPVTHGTGNATRGANGAGGASANGGERTEEMVRPRATGETP
jgi:AcrR family transcriptional regulator